MGTFSQSESCRSMHRSTCKGACSHMCRDTHSPMPRCAHRSTCRSAHSPMPRIAHRSVCRGTHRPTPRSGKGTHRPTPRGDKGTDRPILKDEHRSMHVGLHMAALSPMPRVAHRSTWSGTHRHTPRSGKGTHRPSPRGDRGTGRPMPKDEHRSKQAGLHTGAHSPTAMGACNFCNFMCRSTQSYA